LQAAGVLFHLQSLGLCTLHSEEDIAHGKEVLLANPRNLTSADSLGVGTSLPSAPCGCFANKQPALVSGLGTFHGATKFTGEK